MVSNLMECGDVVKGVRRTYNLVAALLTDSFCCNLYLIFCCFMKSSLGSALNFLRYYSLYLGRGRIIGVALV